MGDKTAIEWTDATWGPVTGCTKVSAGCDNCYAETLAERFRGTPGHYYEHGFDVQLRPEKLDQPLRWRRPRRIFVNSMSDLFHDDVSDDYIAQVFSVMAASPRHTFQVLTKRHGRMRSLLNSYTFWMSVCYYERKIALARGFTGDGPHIGVNNPLPNVWLGVSAENQQWADIRIPALLDTPAAVRFVSAEPLLGHIEFFGSPANPGPAIRRVGVQLHPSGPWGPAEYDYDYQFGIDWVIVGGESGHGARPMHPGWVRDIRDQCVATDTAFLFKQWGEWVTEDQSPQDIVLPGTSRLHWGDSDASAYKVGKKAAGRELDGRTWDQYPEVVTP